MKPPPPWAPRAPARPTTPPATGEHAPVTDIDQLLQDKLTPEQHAAATATATQPEVLALACSGSGKSRTLAYRIALLVANGAHPSGIVAFTFTGKAAESIKIRVAEALRDAGLDRPSWAPCT